jgi:hypothetical protein
MIGSLIYPKLMKEAFSARQLHDVIDQIHTCLYSFTWTKLYFLSRFQSFRFLVHFFTQKYREDVLERCETMRKARVDYESGFDYLIKFIFDKSQNNSN